MSKVTKEGTKVVVKPDQNIVASMAQDFKKELRNLLDGSVKELAVDLENVKMVDSSGLGVLIAAHNSLQKDNASLELSNISDDILKLLKNMRLDKHFIIK